MYGCNKPATPTESHDTAVVMILRLRKRTFSLECCCERTLQAVYNNTVEAR